MHENTHKIESLLGDVARKCNSSALESIKEEPVHVQDNPTRESMYKPSLLPPQSDTCLGLERRKFAAQVALLNKCRTVIPKLLKRSGFLTLAAKLLTISRLLHKNLSHEDTPTDLLEVFRSKIAALRRALLTRVDRRLASPKSTLDQLLDAMSAFCLATSSSSTDALKHLQALRLDTIRRHNDHHESLRKASSTLQIWIQTLRTTKGLLEGPLLDEFKILRGTPIMNDPELLRLEGMNIDLYQKWVSPELVNFIPWMKIVEFSSDEASFLLDSWSKSAFKQFLEHLRQSLDSTDAKSAVLDVRSDLFQAWLPIWKTTPSHSISDVIFELRSVINHRLRQQFRRTGQRIVEVLNQVQHAIDQQQKSRVRIGSLWAHSYMNSSLESGAELFKSELIARHSGQPPDLAGVLNLIDEWALDVRQSEAVIEGLRKVRWLDTIEEEEDDDETDILALNRALQIEDPDTFAEAHQSGLADGLLNFQNGLYEYLESQRLNSADIVLRLIRGVCQTLITAFPKSNLARLTSTIPALHEQLTNDVLRTVKITWTTRGNLLSGRHLWDGQPPIPIQPSSNMFRFLDLLVKTMTRYGEDLWIVPAVDILKNKVWSAVITEDLLHLNDCAKSSGVPNHHSNSNQRNGDVLTNGNSDTVINSGPMSILRKSSEEERPQVLFDLLFLRAALSTDRTTHLVLGDGLASLYSELSLEENSLKRMNEKANAYWERTKLLFGPLAP